VFSDWILQFSKEISRLLPSGLQLLGLFSVADEDLHLENFNLLPSSLVKLYSDFLAEVSHDESLLALHCNLANSKLSYGTVELKVPAT
jgi:hypothetical protein